VCASSAAIGSGIRDERVNRHCLFLSAVGAGWLGEGWEEWVGYTHSAFSTSVNGDGLRLGFVSSRHEVDFEGGRAVPPENKR